MSLTAVSNALSSPIPTVCDQRAPIRHRIAPRSTVYFFLDFSNIAISAGQIAPDHGDSLFDRSRVRIHSQNLREFVERERLWGSGYAAVGLWNQRASIKDRFEEVGIRFDICERGQNSGTEQNVDERIQYEMLHLLDPAVERGTIVLATGDGNGFADKRGFIRTLSILHAYGFQIEVMSWRHSFNGMLREWADQYGRVIELDDFYHELTFVEGRRRSTTPYQLNRKLARLGVA